MKKNIMHAGGIVNFEGGYKKARSATNSVEAVLHSCAIGETYIELDCVPLYDGFAFAHDSTEDRFYALPKAFSETSLAEYRMLKVFQIYTPLTFDTLSYISAVAKDVSFIIDFKGSLSEFSQLVIFSKANYPDLFKKFVFQTYNPQWTEALMRLGGQRSLTALWRYYDTDLLSAESLNFLRDSIARVPFMLGVSVRWSRNKEAQPWMEDARFGDLRAIGCDIFFHGQDIQISLARQFELNEDYGFFTKYSVLDLPADFDPQRYLEKYADLRHMTPIAAMSHYLQFGMFEKRAYS